MNKPKWYAKSKSSDEYVAEIDKVWYDDVKKIMDKLEGQGRGIVFIPFSKIEGLGQNHETRSVMATNLHSIEFCSALLSAIKIYIERAKGTEYEDVDLKLCFRTLAEAINMLVSDDKQARKIWKALND